MEIKRVLEFIRNDYDPKLSKYFLFEEDMNIFLD